MKHPASATSPPHRPATTGCATHEGENADTDGIPTVPLTYLVHDLGDAAVRRRVSLLRSAGADIHLAGFHRARTAPAAVEGIAAHALGHTRDGALLARAGSVLRHWIAPSRLRGMTRHAQVIVARNLETLVLAARVRRPGQRLVYECLDLHRLLLGNGLPSRLLRMIEARAMRHVNLAIVSAPAFRDRYFRARRGWGGEIALVENLVPASPHPISETGSASPPPSLAAPLPAPLPAHAPWRIGWFGMLRCRRSLDILRQLAAAHPHHVEVLIAGRPSSDIFPDFAAEIAAAPGMTFHGSYAAKDLPGLYAQVHFAWTIDYFEEGLNSAWLLPNRLYEGLAHGAVPLALGDVATGEWLAARGVGVPLHNPGRELPEFFRKLTPQRLVQLRAAIERVPRNAVIMDAARARTIGRTIMGQA